MRHVNRQGRSGAMIGSMDTLGQLYKPAHDEAARQRFVGVLKGYANGSLEQQLAARFQIRSIPTLALFWHGREIARQPGAMGQADIVRWARAALDRAR